MELLSLWLSVIGLIATLIGFIITIWQLLATKSAALAAEAATSRVFVFLHATNLSLLRGRVELLRTLIKQRDWNSSADLVFALRSDIAQAGSAWMDAREPGEKPLRERLRIIFELLQQAGLADKMDKEAHQNCLELTAGIAVTLGKLAGQTLRESERIDANS